MVLESQWDPAQYNRFADQREQPFWDLAALLEPTEEPPQVVDLGCGDGRLTAELHRRLGARHTLGVDSSGAMLAEAAGRSGPGLSFEEADIAAWSGYGFDVVFSNAALQWVADHRRVLHSWRDALGPNGQLAIQVPANADHPSHMVARELAAEWFGPEVPADPVAENVLRPEEYAQVLADLGFERQHVRLQVYAHRLASTGDVVDWVKGTSLTRFRNVLPPPDFDRFLVEYRRRLLGVLGDRNDYFFLFKRILLWGRLG